MNDFERRIKVSKEVQKAINKVPQLIEESKERIIIVDKVVEESNARVEETKKIIEVERDEER